MEHQVIFFSRKGTSLRVAEKIASLLNAEIIEITDNINWKGFWGFIKGGFYASINKKVKISLSKNLDEFKGLIVVTPLWAGKLVPAINTFLLDKEKEKIYLVVTSDGSIIKDRSNFRAIIDIVKNKNDEDAVISNFVTSLS
jgi:flavodoxin